MTASAAAPSARLAEIDGVRGLACLMIFAFHSWQFAGSPSDGPLAAVAAFPAGVDLFMVLSGFCLYLPLAVSSRRLASFDLRTYARRRVRRIVPPYYAAIAFCVALPYLLKAGYEVLGRSADAQALPALGDLLSHLTFSHSLFADHWDGINGSFWSLGLEAQFYVLFPLLVWGVRRHAVTAMVAALAVSVAYRVVVDVTIGQGDYPQDFLWTVTGVGRWMQFVAGMAAATVVARGVVVPRAVRQLLGPAVLGLLVSAAALPAVVVHLPVRDLLLASGFGLLLWTVCLPGPLQRIFGSRPAVGFGVMSYSVFLIHQPVVYYVQQALERLLGISEQHTTLLLVWTLGFAVVLLVARGFFAVFERPFLASSRRSEEHAAP